MSWSREQVACLLNEYKKHPCLYVVKSVNYKNKHARADALEKVLTELKCLRPNVTIAEIKAKYSALRSNFLVEHRKHEASKKNGTETKEIYCPSIWYYDSMTFILKHWLPRTSVYDNIHIDFDEQQNDHKHNSPENTIIEEREFLDDLPVEETISSYDSIIQNDSTPSTSFENTIIQEENKRKQRKRKIEKEKIDNNHKLLKSALTLYGISSMLKVQRKTKENNIDIFLKFLGLKLEKIKNVTIYENTEDKILQVANEALNLDKCTK